MELKNKNLNKIEYSIKLLLASENLRSEIHIVNNESLRTIHSMYMVMVFKMADVFPIINPFPAAVHAA